MHDVHWNIEVTEPPEVEPVTLDEAKTALREDGDAQDTHITGLISAVRGMQENALRSCFNTQTIVLRLSSFPCDEIEIPRMPLQSVTSIQYVDTNGVTQTLNPTQYQVSRTSRPPHIRRAYGVFWPFTRCQDDAVIVTAVCGFGDDADDVPQSLKTALLMRLANIYENREAYTPDVRAYEANPAADALEAPYKLWSF